MLARYVVFLSSNVNVQTGVSVSFRGELPLKGLIEEKLVCDSERPERKKCQILSTLKIASSAGSFTCAETNERWPHAGRSAHSWRCARQRGGRNLVVGSAGAGSAVVATWWLVAPDGKLGGGCRQA